LATVTGTVPTYLKVSRTGTTFTAYTSSDGITWTAIAGSSVTMTMTGTLLAGLAVTSHHSGTLGTVTFTSVTVSTTSCPAGWNCADIGYTAPAGSQSLSSGTWTIQGAGTDIWGTADQFHYVWQTLPADGNVSAKVVTETATDPWTKAGVMLRQTTDPGSAYYAVYVTPGNGITVQYRPSQGASAAQLATLTGTVPAYLEVSRTGTTFTAYTSSDGVTWTAIAGSSVTVSMTGTLLAGLAVASHNGATLATVTFSAVQIGVPTSTCPTGWTCADIGYSTPAGSQTLSSGTWTVQGAGSDIFGTADQFHYVWQTLPGDGGVSAQVVSQTNTSSWAKAGVMLRQTTDPGSAYYAVYVTPSNGIAVQYRKSQGGGAVQLATLTGTVPTYLKVSRTGTTFTAYASSDGVTWTPIAGSSVTMTMTGSLLAGLAVTSHHSAGLCTVIFNSVIIG
jgi:hypothetical protein